MWYEISWHIIHYYKGSYRRVVDHIVAYNSIHAADTYAICPLLIGIRTTRAYIVILNSYVIAGQGSLSNMKARPAPWIERVDIFDQLIRVGTSHLNICSARGRRCAKPCAIDLRRRNACELNHTTVKNHQHTWILRSFTPLQFAQVPSTAVVWPEPFSTGPSTTSVARSSPVG